MIPAEPSFPTTDYRGEQVIFESDADRLAWLATANPAGYRAEVAKLAQEAQERELRRLAEQVESARAKARAAEAAAARQREQQEAAARVEAAARDREARNRDPQRLAGEIESLLTNPARRGAQGTDLRMDVAMLRQDLDVAMQWIVAVRNREAGS